MNTHQELLSVFAKRLWRIAQLPDEQLPSLLEIALSLKNQRDFVGESALDRRAFLKLPSVERNTLLSQQVAAVSQYFQAGTEEMEWIEEYVYQQNAF